MTEATTQDLNSSTTTVAAWLAHAMKERGIDRIFGLQGGHIQPIWDHVARLGIRIIDVRDEGAAVHMAHAHAELTGGIGIVMVTAGPGVTNTVSGVANASLARAPVVVIGGCTSRPQANMGPLQDIPHVDILKPVCRYARTARVPEQALREFDEALACALGDLGEPGPAYISNSRPTCCAAKCRGNWFSTTGWRRNRPAGCRPSPRAWARRLTRSARRSVRWSSAAAARAAPVMRCSAFSTRSTRSTSTPRKAAAWCRPSIPPA
jgi:acetolactate synthase-1/2/3 large subunit